MTDTSELVKRLRQYEKSGDYVEDGLLEKAAQAIERLERERDNAIEQAAMECAVVEELDKTCKVLRQQLADAKAEELRIHNEKVDHFERAIKAERELAEARGREGRYREALDQAHAAMWDSYYGKGIAVEYARQVSEVVGEALAPEPSAAAELPSAPGAWSGTRSEAEARGYLPKEPDDA